MNILSTTMLKMKNVYIIHDRFDKNKIMKRSLIWFFVDETTYSKGRYIATFATGNLNVSLLQR